MENANSRFDPSQGIDQLGSLLTGIYDQYENWAKNKGINYTVFAILYFVYYREHCTQSDICAFGASPNKPSPPSATNCWTRAYSASYRTTATAAAKS